jgi:DNA-binding GntR family transcriptional regulator
VLVSRKKTLPPPKRSSTAEGLGQEQPAAKLRSTKRFRDVESGSRATFVYTQIRSEIRDHELRPGDRLREIDIAERLGVSRTPVREALKRLEAEGLIIYAQPRGLVVTELSHSDVMQLYAMREVLEGAAARFAAEQASSMEIRSLQQIVMQERSVKTAAEAVATNLRFHEAISTAAHNEYLLKAMNVLQDALSLLGTTTYSTPGRIATAAQEHSDIVDCIAKHDPEAAEKTARQHIHMASSLRLEMLFGQNN